MLKSLLLATAVGATILAAVSPASAAYNCGRYMRGLFGISNSAYNLALNWARFPRTTAHAGAVVVSRRAGHNSGGGPGGHVAKIVSVMGSCKAVVQDNRGQYTRNICKNLVAIVTPTRG